MAGDTAKPIVGVILAGGRSRRMGGGDKALTDLRGRPLLAHLIARLRPQVDTLVLNANGDPGRFANFGIPIIADTIPDFVGPLAGLLAGMRWAEANLPGVTEIATTPVDAPFPPRDLVEKLRAAKAAASVEIAVARSAGRLHPICGVFSIVLADQLENHLRTSGSLRVTDWLGTRSVTVVDFPVKEGAIDPFFNINTPEDLASAEAALAGELQARTT